MFSVLAFQNSQAQFVKAGVGLMYGTEIEQPGIRVDGVYQINEEIRAVADFGFYLPDETESSGGGVTSTTTSTYWELNLNGNYIFSSDTESGMTAYALAGLNYLNFNVDSEASGGGFTGSTSFSDSEVGLNVGAGIEYALDFGDLFGEAKYVIGDFDQLNIGAGLRFNF
ncbi:outer membrane protein [Gracilimonas sp.]|uniref:outer membrane protein n=1 Tax=Gracilimonas sp. TaxID=1974203 RepID=UPI0028718071|nr:outer membrane beta-barrel protein [Gracilimonas sp.]